MIPVAHVGGMPVEELLPAFGGPVGGLLMVRAWLAVSFHRRAKENR